MPPSSWTSKWRISSVRRPALAHDRERLGEHRFERFPLADPAAQGLGPRTKLPVGERGECRFQRVDALDGPVHPTQLPVIAGADDLVEQILDHPASGSVRNELRRAEYASSLCVILFGPSMQCPVPIAPVHGRRFAPSSPMASPSWERWQGGRTSSGAAKNRSKATSTCPERKASGSPRSKAAPWSSSSTPRPGARACAFLRRESSLTPLARWTGPTLTGLKFGSARLDEARGGPARIVATVAGRGRAPVRDAQAIRERGWRRGAAHDELKLERQGPTELARPALRRNPAGISLVEEPSR